MTNTVEVTSVLAISRKWSERHARARLAAATGNYHQLTEIADEIEEEVLGKSVEGSGEDAGSGVESADAEG